jgi:hypothetical protein
MGVPFESQFQTPEIATTRTTAPARLAALTTASIFFTPSTKTTGTLVSPIRSRGVPDGTARTLPGAPRALQGCSYLWPGFFGSGALGRKL